MKIKIVNDEFKLSLKLPTRLLKSRLIWHFILKKAEKNNDLLLEMSKHRYIIFSTLIQYVKTNGHFTFIHIVSNEGTEIKIDI